MKSTFLRSQLAAACTAAVLLVGPVAAQAAEVVVNGGFETGDFTGWQGVVNAVVAGSDPVGLNITPASGSNMAIIGYPDYESTGALLQVVSFDATDLSALTVSAKMNVVMANGLETVETILGNFLIGFYNPDDLGAGPIATLMSADTTLFLGDPPQLAGPNAVQTGWIPFGTVLTGLPLSGIVSVGIGFQVSDQAPPGTALMLLIDDVSVDVATATTTVPVPAPWFLMLGALAATARLARRRA